MTGDINPSTFEAAAGGDGWRVIGDGACTFYATTSFAESSRLVAAIASIPGIQDHAPDLDVRRDGVTVRLLTRRADYYGMSERDIDTARAISEVADGMGFNGDPGKVQNVLVIPGGPDPAAIMPFWQAILGYDRRPDSPAE